MQGRIVCGHALTVLRNLPAESVHCVVTSPPYWGLRDYGIEPRVWGGKPGCAHEWGAEKRKGGGSHTGRDLIRHSPDVQAQRQAVSKASTGAFCRLCGAWSGSLGLEPTPELYVEHIVQVFHEVRRLLRADGTLWLNLGDSYSGGGRAGRNGQAYGGLEAQNRYNAQVKWGPPTGKIAGLKQKDLVGIPWRVAFALQADGWYLRSDIIWHKPNPMPESVTDRPTKAHEYLFLLSKNARYYYDAEAIKEPQAPHTLEAFKNGCRPRNPKSVNNPEDIKAGKTKQAMWNNMECMADVGGRNRRSVWTIATQPFPEAHFATFPEGLVEPCILAGTSERGVCAKCGAPWVRVVRRRNWSRKGSDGKHGRVADEQFSGRRLIESTSGARLLGGPHDNPFPPKITVGWRPTCSCDASVARPVVLDPFAGAGTVGLVAAKLNREYVLIEIKPEYAGMAGRRIREALPLFMEAT